MLWFFATDLCPLQDQIVDILWMVLQEMLIKFSFSSMRPEVTRVENPFPFGLNEKMMGIEGGMIIQEWSYFKVADLKRNSVFIMTLVWDRNALRKEDIIQPDDFPGRFS